MTNSRPRRISRITDDPVKILSNAGPTMSVPEAGVCFYLGEAKARRLAAAGKFPVEVLRLGSRLRVRTADVRRALGLPIEDVAAADAAPVAS